MACNCAHLCRFSNVNEQMFSDSQYSNIVHFIVYANISKCRCGRNTLHKIHTNTHEILLDILMHQHYEYSIYYCLIFMPTQHTHNTCTDCLEM